MQAALSELSLFFRQLQLQSQRIEVPDLFDEQASRALVLATAALRVAQLKSETWPLPPQLAVIGPTQSGKSTLVNLLLGEAQAVASPLAGYTRHAQGFVSGDLTESMEQTLSRALAGWRRGVPQTQDERQGVFQLVSQQQEARFRQGAGLLWDTPDFDSVGSRSYRDTVPEICALSDALLLVVSREKYADRTVWQLLRLLSPLRKPLMICLNKVAPTEVEALIAALRQRLQQESIEVAGIVTLPYMEGADRALFDTTEAERLRNDVAHFVDACEDNGDSSALSDLLRLYWDDWSTPIRGELTAAAYWQEAVSRGLEEARDAYRRDCLENPSYSYALQRAVVRLLELLEVPGIAATLTRVRSVLTWPARKLQGLLGSKLPLAGTGQHQEQQILLAGITHLLLELQRQAGEQLLVGSGFNRHWWQALVNDLVRRQDGIGPEAESAIAGYLEAFESEIERASQHLYNHLQQHPVTLNGLRAARATTDAAAVVVAIKTGGIGVSDLVLTPALLAFTSLLAEGAVGGYMKQVEAELKSQQMALVEARLFSAVVERSLLAIPDELPERCRFGMTAQQLERVEALIGVPA